MSEKNKGKSFYLTKEGKKYIDEKIEEFKKEDPILFAEFSKKVKEIVSEFFSKES